MGMFDYVKFEMACPKCGKPISEFQTKDLERELITVDYKSTKSFYGMCESCRTWINFIKTKNRNAIGISATYKMEVFDGDN